MTRWQEPFGSGRPGDERGKPGRDLSAVVTQHQLDLVWVELQRLGQLLRLLDARLKHLEERQP